MLARNRRPQLTTAEGEITPPKTPALERCGYLPREGMSKDWAPALAEDIFCASYHGTGRELVKSLLTLGCHVVVLQQPIASRPPSLENEIRELIRPELLRLKAAHPERLLLAEILPGIQDESFPWQRDSLGFFVQGVSEGVRYARCGGEAGFVVGRAPIERRFHGGCVEQRENLPLWDAGGFFYPLGVDSLAITDRYLERNSDLFGLPEISRVSQVFERFGRPHVVALKGLETGHGHVDFCVAQVGDTVFIPEIREIPSSPLVNLDALEQIRATLDHNKRQLEEAGFNVQGLPMPIPLDRAGGALVSPLNMAQTLNHRGERCCIIPWTPDSEIEIHRAGHSAPERIERWPDQAHHLAYQQEIGAKLKAAGAEHARFLPTAPMLGGSAHCMTKEFPLALAKALAS